MPESVAFEEKENIAFDFNKATREKVAAHISERWLHATEDIRELINDSKEGWDYYLRNQPNPDALSVNHQRKDSNTAKLAQRKGLRLGDIPRAVDSILAFLFNTIFPQDDRFFRGNPKNEVARENQELYELYRAENFGEINANEELRKMLLNMMIDGTAAVHLPFKRVEREKTVYEPSKLDLGITKLPIPGTVKEIKKKVVEWEGTLIEPLDFNDWRVDPMAKSLDESWFCRRWYEPVWKVKEAYPNLKDVQAYHEEFDEAGDNDKRDSAGLPKCPISKEEESEGKKQALLMACYDDFEIKGKIYRNHVAVTLNGKELVWFGPNPYNHGKKPYIVAPYIALPGQIYGLSAIKHALPSAAVIDKLTSDSLMISTLAAKPIILKNMRDPAVRKMGNIEVRPGMTLPIEKPDAYRQLDIRINNLAAFQAIIEQCKQNIQETTGASPFIAGDSPEGSGDVTAFEVDQRVQGGNSRFQAIMTNFDNAVLERLLQIVFENDQQFMTESSYINGNELTPELVKQMDFKWVITSTRATLSRNRQLANKKAILTELMPMLVQAGVVKLKPVGLEFDQEQALRSFLVLSGEQDADKLLKTTELPPTSLVPTEEDVVNGGAMNGLPSVPPTPNLGASEANIPDF